MLSIKNIVGTKMGKILSFRFLLFQREETGKKQSSILIYNQRWQGKGRKKRVRGGGPCRTGWWRSPPWRGAWQHPLGAGGVQPAETGRRRGGPAAGPRSNPSPRLGIVTAHGSAGVLSSGHEAGPCHCATVILSSGLYFLYGEDEGLESDRCFPFAHLLPPPEVSTVQIKVLRNIPVKKPT